MHKAALTGVKRLGDEWKRHAGARNPHDIAEGEECGDPRSGTHGFGFTALKRDGSEHDIGDQSQYFCREPAMHEGVLPDLESISQGGSEQHGIDHVRRNFYPAHLEPGGIPQHPDASREKESAADKHSGYMYQFKHVHAGDRPDSAG